jgi:hypothetical protein
MTTSSPGGYVLSNGDGEGIWFLGTLMTVKAGREQTRGGFTLIEQKSPPGFAAPPHVHEAEEEAFYVLEGQLQVTCGDQMWSERHPPGKDARAPTAAAFARAAPRLESTYQYQCRVWPVAGS